MAGKDIKDLMRKALPRCPFCNSDLGYEVVSIFKGIVRCASCGAEWSSTDFLRFEKPKRLKVRELPGSSHIFTRGKYSLKRYDEYPIDFWRSFGKTKDQSPQLLKDKEEMVNLVFKAMLIFFIALIPRILLIDETSIMTDEPLYVSAGRLYFQSYLKFDFNSDVWRQNYEHPPVAKLCIGLLTYLFMPLLGGENIHNLYYSARIAPVTAGTLLAVAIYMLGRKCFGEKASFLGSLLAATSPWLIYYSTLGILDIFAAFFVTLFYLLLPYAKIDNRCFILLGVFLGLAVGSKGTAIAAIPGLILYLLIIMILSFLRHESSEAYPTRMILTRIFLTPAIAGFTFFITWPWLWTHTFERAFRVIDFHSTHMTTGHATFYAGSFYTHVPLWVSGYILFVKTPIVIFALCILFIFSMIFRIVRGERITRGHLSVFSWLIGGVLFMFTFRIIIGDHYLVFLAPAVLVAASSFASDLLERVNEPKAKLNVKTIFVYGLMALMIAECSVGLLRHWVSPCGYANELIARADKAVLIIDTGFEDAADYIIEHCEKDDLIAVAYSTSLLRIELERKGKHMFNLLELEDLDLARYAVFPSIYTQRYGFPSQIKNWTLVYTAKSGETVLCYVFKSPS